MQSGNYPVSFTIGQAEVLSAKYKKLTFTERMFRNINDEIDLFDSKEVASLIISNDNRNEELARLKLLLFFSTQQMTENDKKNLQIIILHLEYERLEKIILSEQQHAKKKENEKRFWLLQYFMTKLENLSLLSMMGAFTSSALSLLGMVWTVIATSAFVVGFLVVLAFSMPVALITMIIGVGIELGNAIINSETPLRGIIIGSDLAILGLVGTTIMVPFNIVPATLMGLPIVMPLLFTGIVAVGYYKDKKHLEYKEKLIEQKNNIITENKNLLSQALRDQNDLTHPTIQRLTLTIAEAEREKAILEIQQKTLSAQLRTHKISLLAVGILFVSLIFPPLSLGAAIAGVVGMGIFLGTSLYGKKLRDNEKKAINEKEHAPEMLIGEIQQSVYNNVLKTFPIEEKTVTTSNSQGILRLLCASRPKANPTHAPLTPKKHEPLRGGPYFGKSYLLPPTSSGSPSRHPTMR